MPWVGTEMVEVSFYFLFYFFCHNLFCHNFFCIIFIYPSKLDSHFYFYYYPTTSHLSLQFLFLFAHLFSFYNFISLLGRLIVQTIEKLGTDDLTWTYITSFPVERRGFLSSVVGECKRESVWDRVCVCVCERER